MSIMLDFSIKLSSLQIVPLYLQVQLPFYLNSILLAPYHWSRMRTYETVVFCDRDISEPRESDRGLDSRFLLHGAFVQGCYTIYLKWYTFTTWIQVSVILNRYFHCLSSLNYDHELKNNFIVCSMSPICHSFPYRDNNPSVKVTSTEPLQKMIHKSSYGNLWGWMW